MTQKELIHDNTEIAFFYLSEMGSLARGGLTKAKLRGLLEEYGPIRTNNVVSSGGVFLVELCRARKVRESVILACVQEMVSSHGALVDKATRESERCRETPLCVAAARGMPTVVNYLLQQGASPELRSSGRFRLHHVPKRTLARTHVRPLEFAQASKSMPNNLHLPHHRHSSRLTLVDVRPHLLRSANRRKTSWSYGSFAERARRLYPAT